MDSLIQFLLTSGDRFSVGGLLATGFALTVVALYREWIVMGGPYHRCMKENAQYRADEKAEASAEHDELLLLRKEFSELKERMSRRKP